MTKTKKNQMGHRVKLLVRLGPKHQVTIPKSIVETLHLRIGDMFEPQVQNGKVVLIPKQLVDKKQVSSRTSRQRRRARERSQVDEWEDWRHLALNALERAYSDDEPEYTSDLIKEPNPEYEGR